MAKSAASRARFIGGTAAAAALTYGSVPAILAQSKSIVVGLNVPQSGPYSDQGQDQLRAYNLAIDEINKSGGVMGSKVTASVGDDQTTANVARDNAQRMIERDGAIMITGGPGSVLGAVVIGMLFGFTQAAVSVFASPTVANFCYLGVMLVVMVLKLSGVFAR